MQLPIPSFDTPLKRGNQATKPPYNYYKENTQAAPSILVTLCMLHREIQLTMTHKCHLLWLQSCNHNRSRAGPFNIVVYDSTPHVGMTQKQNIWQIRHFRIYVYNNE